MKSDLPPIDLEWEIEVESESRPHPRVQGETRTQAGAQTRTQAESLAEAETRTQTDAQDEPSIPNPSVVREELPAQDTSIEGAAPAGSVHALPAEMATAAKPDDWLTVLNSELEKDLPLDILPSEAEDEASLQARGGEAAAREGSSDVNESGEPLQRSLCAFWINGQCFALDLELVGEVVLIDAVLSVPRTPAAILGIFNLRGAPIPLLDLAAALELDSGAVTGNAAPSQYNALVLRANGITAGAVIERVDRVLNAGRERFRKPSPGDAPIAAGFVHPRQRPDQVVTILDSAVVLARLEKLKFRPLAKQAPAARSRSAGDTRSLSG